MTRISKKLFDTMSNGQQVYEYLMENQNLTVGIITYGAAIRKIVLKNKDEQTDVVFGFDNMKGYEDEKHDSYLGATIGRFANRIKGGRFELNGEKYQLNLNNGKCHLHGGNNGFNKKLFSAKIIDSEDSVELNYVSPDMEENFPGNLNFTVRYTLTDQNELKIRYTATTDRDTILSITNHSYFNLLGQKSTILGHQLKLHADQYLELDEDGIVNGKIDSAKNTPFDFTDWKPVGDAALADHPQILIAKGMDHAFIFGGDDKKLKLAAELKDPSGKKELKVYTDMPAFHVYSGNFLEGKFVGKEGVAYGKNSAICFEPEHYPDSTAYAHFPSPVLRANELYDRNIVYKFTVK
jgi:Galactose mutarotase and related enzymes